MKKLTIASIPALKDNYIYALTATDTKTVVIIDPGESEPVVHWLNQHNLSLAAILITHHHGDHTHGVLGLLTHWQVPVYGSEIESFPGKSKNISHHSLIHLPGFPGIQVIAIPGHTLGHVAYLIEDALFCGDTLFSAGCGRLFEGSAAQLYHSLQILSALPDATLVYCAHEYTVQNCRFAHLVEPSNQAVILHLEKASQLTQNNISTLPSSIKLEKAINPFLRCHSAEIRQHIEKQFDLVLDDELAAFTKLREWKNNFS